jgi:adenine specific DNA methylase Mod
MYPRLYIAKQLLKDEGVIFVSIDDNEVAQLRLLMDEVFGEENFAFDFVKEELKAEPTIFEITKERILRASKRIKTEIDNNIKSKEKEIKELEGKLDLEGKDDNIKQLQSEIVSLKNQDLGFLKLHRFGKITILKQNSLTVRKPCLMQEN